MADRPGIMIYFDISAPLKRLGYEEKGRLLEAMLEYGQYGVVPELDGILLFVWDFIQPKLDADAKQYRHTVLQKTHASFCAKEKKAGRTPMDFEEWCESECIDRTTWNRMEPHGSERYPTTSTTTATATIPTVTTTTKTASNTEGKGEGSGEGKCAWDEWEAKRQRKIEELRNYSPA